MTIKEQAFDYAGVDREVGALVQRGVHDSVAATLAPMLASSNVSVYRQAIQWANDYAILGLDLSNEGQVEAAAVLRAARTFLSTQRAAYGPLAVPSIDDEAQARYAPNDAAVHSQMDRQLPGHLRVGKDKPAPLGTRKDILRNMDVLTPEAAEALDGQLLAVWAGQS